MVKPRLSIQVAKDEISKQTLEAIRTLKARGVTKSLGALFYILDAGNGPFYVYAATGPESSNQAWQAVLENEDEVADGTFSWSTSIHTMIRDGSLTAQDVQADDFAETSTGDLIRIGKGDSALNLFLGRIAQEVILELSNAGAFDELLHPKGCTVYFSDDEVLAHESLIKCVIGRRGLFRWPRAERSGG